MPKKIKKYLLSSIIISFLVFFSGCSNKVIENTNSTLYVGVASGIAIYTAPVWIPLAGGMSLSEKALLSNEYKDFNTKQSILKVHGNPDDLYKYEDKQIWVYYDMRTANTEFINDIFFLIQKDTVVDYYTAVNDIDDWDKYILED